MTTKLETINRGVAAALRTKLDKALAESPEFRRVTDELGLTIALGNAKFTDVDVTFQLKLALPGKLSVRIIEIAKVYGIDATKAGAEGQRIVDMKSGARPWVVKHVDGKLYRYPDAMAQRVFPGEKPQDILQNSEEGDVLTEEPTHG
jgi:hypothetical protein